MPALSIAVGTAFVLMRSYTGIFVTRKFGFADYAILIGYGTFVGFAVMCVLAVEIGPGIHMWDLRLRDLGPFLYYLRVASTLYAPCILFLKLSILVQYIRIFMPNRQPRALYWSTILLGGANAISYLVLLLMQIWSCTPMRKSWDPLVVGGYCLDTSALNVSASSINVISDIAIFVLPQAIIWRLNMPLKQKLQVSTIFLIAALAIAAAAVRLYYTTMLVNSADVTWYSWYMGIWALVEMDLGIIVACLPVGGVFMRSLGQSSVYTTVSTSLKRITTGTWKRGQGTSSYILEDQKGTDARGSYHPNTQGSLWVKTDGASDMDTLVPVRDYRSARSMRPRDSFA
ncbi:unnamed protein product [Discula destructiva]